MEDKKEIKVVNKGGIGFVGVLTILFIALKLCGVISWSWVWVLAPIWIEALIIVALILFIVVLTRIAKIIDNIGY